MTDKELYEWLDSIYPFDKQEEWDQSKIYFDFFNKEINTIGLCLDATLNVVNKAIIDNIDILISHHPLYLDINDAKKPHIKKTINLLYENQINLISCHTNFDKAKNGTNDSLLKELKLKNIKRLSKSDYAFVGELNKPENIYSLIENIKYCLNVEYVLFDKSDYRILNHLDVKRVCILGGAGSSEIETILKKDKIDVFITGEVKWHQWELAKQKKVTILQVPHSVEKIIIKKMKELLKDFKTIEYQPLTVFETR